MRSFLLATSLLVASCGMEDVLERLSSNGDAPRPSAAEDAPSEGVYELSSASVAAVKDEPAARSIAWQTLPAGGPVTITKRTASGEADMVAEGTTSTPFLYQSEENKRTYFTVEATGGSSVTTALRVLPLEGGRNFRDLGGYPTEDGRTIRWGKIFRSGYLSGLTDSDYVFLEDIGIKTVVDFRASEERVEEATDWRAGEVEILTWDYTMQESAGELFSVFMREGITPQDVTDMMAGFYKEMVYEHADKYTAMFDRLITTDDPLAYHCSAGKDRTGVATALILTALGVPRDVIIEDYTMTERVVDYSKDFDTEDGEEIDENSSYGFLAKLPSELVAPLMRSNRVYIEAALEELETDHGSVMAFVQGELGVDEDELAVLRDKYLTD